MSNRPMRSVAILLGMAAVCALSGVALAQAKPPSDPCANRLCTKYKSGTPSCMRFHYGAQGMSAEQRQVRCYISRAVRHYRVNLSRALYIASRESKLHRVPKPANQFGYKGPFQMSRVLFGQTPYGKRLGDKRESAKWAALAYAFLENLGMGCHWNPPRYCG